MQLFANRSLPHRHHQPLRRALIAQLLGWSTATMHAIHSRWAKDREALFDLHGRGGRRLQHMSAEEGTRLLAPFAAKAHIGRLLHVSEIKQALERQVCDTVAASTVSCRTAMVGARSYLARTTRRPICKCRAP